MPLIKILLELTQHPHTSRYGYDLAHCCGLKASVVYTVLGRMTDASWVTWEVELDGPRLKHHYHLTSGGMVAAQEMLEEAKGDQRFTHLFTTAGD